IEGDEIDYRQIITLMKDGATIKTSQPPIGEMMAFFEKLLETHEGVLYIPLSSGLSGTYQTACMAAADYDGKVTIVDAKSACAPVQLLAKWAKEMLAKDYDVLEIKRKLEEETYMYACIVPGDLIYLKRGGRISATAAALGNVLKIVPILSVDQGKIDAVDKVRTFKKAVKVAMHYATNVENKDDYEWMIIDTNVDYFDSWVEEYETLVHVKPLKKQMQAVILGHVGPGSICVGRIKKLKY
ncbi:MAG: DegV family protein, partial [Erysipelotrichaceae bacterium]|nr:DegV family protein [Erysipelotrichaceae bacterium]